jgi:hypothetical protein
VTGGKTSSGNQARPGRLPPKFCGVKWSYFGWTFRCLRGPWSVVRLLGPCQKAWTTTNPAPAPDASPARPSHRPHWMLEPGLFSHSLRFRSPSPNLSLHCELAPQLSLDSDRLVVSRIVLIDSGLAAPTEQRSIQHPASSIPSKVLLLA